MTTTPTTTTTPARPAAAPRLLLGHPLGLAFLVFAEGWERFSFYGMQALLVLYMSHDLLRPAHVRHVAGFAGFRAAIEGVYGPLSTPALASVIFGLYAGGVYLTPLAGGLLADRLLGRTRTVTLGALLMAAGHFLMAFDASFLAALTCLLVGVGCFKGNISSQVGELYPPGDLRRAEAFQIFLIAVSVAVIVSPLVCGTLGQERGWHWGFGAAGVGMLVGLGVYRAGSRWLPPEPRRRGGAQRGPRLAPTEARTVAVLVALLPALALAMLCNMQTFNAYLIWADANYDLVFFGRSMPVTWLLSLDAVIDTGTIVLTMLSWRWWARHRPEPDEITKLAIGTLLAATAPLILSLASAREAPGSHAVGLAWGLAFHVVNSIGIANVLPVGLALFSRAAPRAVSGLMIGVYYLHLFVANMAVGWLGGLLQTMPAAAFWLLHAGLVASGGVVFLLFRRHFGRLLAPTSDPQAGSSDRVTRRGIPDAAVPLPALQQPGQRS